KHVLCEKPTALDAGEAEEMVKAASEKPHLAALMDHELRFLPSRRTFHRALRDGTVGEIFHVEGAFFSSFRLDPAGRWSWWSDRKLGGGMLGALGSHVVDSLTWLLGRRVEAVAAQEGVAHAERLDVAGHPKTVTADDYAALQLRFEGGLPGTIQLSAVSAGPATHRLAVFGSEGTLVWEDGRLSAYRPGFSEPRTLAVDPPTALPHGVPNQPFTRGTLYLGGALRQALQEGDAGALEPAASMADGLEVQRVLDAARRSAETGVWVEVP
ncbi:MAG: Gfo/Idh/MocA family oxidoreductase, partial [Acidobacteria bacterium]|nr:Gfo/Idh/MocA family oxidoreductase [Acidobacteriota bacterium]